LEHLLVLDEQLVLLLSAEMLEGVDALLLEMLSVLLLVPLLEMLSVLLLLLPLLLPCVTQKQLLQRNHLPVPYLHRPLRVAYDDDRPSSSVLLRTILLHHETDSVPYWE
jgi:hypothetical protein